jgi:hypothetical protein
VADRCLDVLGMMDERIPDKAISASSTYGSSPLFAAKYARLNGNKGGGGWCPLMMNSSRNGEEWIQINLKSTKTISGLSIQVLFQK